MWNNSSKRKKKTTTWFVFKQWEKTKYDRHRPVTPTGVQVIWFAQAVAVRHTKHIAGFYMLLSAKAPHFDRCDITQHKNKLVVSVFKGMTHQIYIKHKNK